MAAVVLSLLTLLAAQRSLVQSVGIPYARDVNSTYLPYNPRPAPAYMVDNQDNYYHVAPDKGKHNGPVWSYSGSLDGYLSNLQRGYVLRGGYGSYNGTSNGTRQTSLTFPAQKLQSSSDYWLSKLAQLGSQPLAGGKDYQFFRNVVDDFGADNSGKSNTAESLNAASASWNKDSVGGKQTRCGQQCGNTFSQGAILFFPGGTYKICSPVIQYYYTHTLLSGGVDLWATGKRYNGDKESAETGTVKAPARGKGLNGDDGKLYMRSRPQYEKKSPSDFLVATTDGECKNDASGDQASCINDFLRSAVDKGKIAFFPAGIYAVGSTVHVPTNSVIQGSSWSQMMGSGFYFSDMTNPKVMVQVGNKGDIGTMEITEMLFSVRGATAGAILMEWNVAAKSQGAAALWDSHFRVGGALATHHLATCPRFSNNAACIAASLLFRVTPQANGYFENVRAWVGDHDNDQTIVNQPDSSATQISVFAARGMLIESQGPSWFYGGGSEHSVLYNYLLSGAKSVFMGHIQTESPYYQPNPRPPDPFRAGTRFPDDPDFSGCELAAAVEGRPVQLRVGSARD
ncbi:putative glucan endo-1,3-beta-glucosidase [Beauveria bassiana]|uniref:Putative glucan endo-1,3-beta-glucosidase n=1 Tax=Beauveria bassiana TaxID=176275 RepID=A0A2N6N996_BEABA|nr:putative glucan endo-1,3-beta-glucosidase [Beauveria bassiana]